MNKKAIKKTLEDVFFNNAEMDYDLYEYELEELLDELKESQKQDKDECIFAVTVNHINENYSCAMVLLDKNQKVYINEQAREELKTYWHKHYQYNAKFLLPTLVKQLHNDEIPINGVQIMLEA